MSAPTASDERATEHVLTRPERLATLRRSVLLDTPAEEAFDRLTRLAGRIIGAPVALVSLVDTDRQFFKSCVGLPEPYATARETPLSHSFCQHAVATGEPLIIEDARQHPLVAENLAIPDLNVIAYAGIPLMVDGETLGSFCVIDGKPRQWTEEEISTLTDLAASAATEIELRLAKADLEEQAASARTAERELTALLESTGEGIYGIDHDGRCTFINPAAVEALGYHSARELLGANLLDTIHPSARSGESPAREVRAIRTVLREGRGVRLDEAILHRRDGSSFPASFSAYPLVMEGSVRGVVVAFTDITDRRAIEEERGRLLLAEQEAREKAEAAVRARDEMLAIVSHDLRNPASTIYMSAALIAETPLEVDKQKQQLGIIRRQAERMTALINDLLDVTLLEAGRFSMLPGESSVGGLLREAAELAAPEAATRGVALEVACSVGGARVKVDRDRIEQVFANLIGNALKFTPAGGRIRLTADGVVSRQSSVVGERGEGDAEPRGDGELGEVVFGVEDTGPGISAEDQAHLFDRYWQGGTLRKGGAGLGLAIAKGIVEMHGGRMWVESEPGAGAAFRFVLPAA